MTKKNRNDADLGRHPNWLAGAFVAAEPDMPMWKELVCEDSGGFYRLVRVLGSDEAGHVVHVTEHSGGPWAYREGMVVPQTLPPRNFYVFMPLPREQIFAIFSHRKFQR